MVRVTSAYSATLGSSRGCHCERGRLYFCDSSTTASAAVYPNDNDARHLDVKGWKVHEADMRHEVANQLHSIQQPWRGEKFKVTQLGIQPTAKVANSRTALVSVTFSLSCTTASAACIAAVDLVDRT